MTLTVTPGAADADSYGTLSGALAYHSAMGHGTWTGDDADLETALRRATKWVDRTYRAKFQGSKLNGRDQSLEWPRDGVYDPDGNYVDHETIPIEIETATYEAALRELVSPGGLSPDYTSSASVKREKVGEIEVEYADTSGASSVQPVLTVVDGIISGLLGSVGGGMRGIVRA